MAYHNLFSPSSSAIWKECLNSKKLSKDDIEVSSAAALRGAMLHEILYHHLIQKMTVEKKRTPKTFDHSKISSENALIVQVAFDTIVKDLTTWGARLYPEHLYLEEKNDLILNSHNIGGTADVIFYDPMGKFLSIYDFKLGKILVSPKDNSQLILYAIAVLPKFPDCETIRLRIIQPPHNCFNAYTLSKSELKEKYQLITEKLVKNDYGFYPGDHCRFCPSKKKCPKIKKAFTTLEKPNKTVEERLLISSVRTAVIRLITETKNKCMSLLAFNFFLALCLFDSFDMFLLSNEIKIKTLLSNLIIYKNAADIKNDLE